MAALATQADVEARWRDLRGNEPTNCAAWLDDASAQIRVAVPGIDASIAASEDLESMVRGAVAMAAVRMFRGRDPSDKADYTSVYIAKSDLTAIQAAVGMGVGDRTGLPGITEVEALPAYPDPAAYGWSSPYGWATARD